LIATLRRQCQHQHRLAGICRDADCEFDNPTRATRFSMLEGDDTSLQRVVRHVQQRPPRRSGLLIAARPTGGAFGVE
jgi:hypothetical protein